MVYIIFIGLVFAAAAASPTGTIGNAILLTSGLAACATSATTVGVSMALGGTSSASEAVRTNLWALVAVGLIFVFGFQVGSKVSVIFLLTPFLAYLVASVILSKGLGISFPRALLVAAVATGSIFLALRLFGVSILRAVSPAH